MKVLHIAAHMGGGIGAAYAGLGTCGLDQRIVLLEEPIDNASFSRVEQRGFAVDICPSREALTNMLKDSDIVLFNWSHHPAVTALMCDFPSVPIRSMLWVHVSGNYFPAIQPNFLSLFDQCVFATPFSLELPQIKAMGQDYAKEHFEVVYGLGDLSRFFHVQPRQHEGFVVGYVGTLNPCKLNADFMDYAAAAVDVIPDIRFVFAGDPQNKDELLKKASSLGIYDRINILGRVNDIPALLSKIDVFGYLLNPQHYGATENALLEAMAAGVPAVALEQCVERLIIEDGKTGLLVKNKAEFAMALKNLHTDAALRTKIMENARRQTLERYAIEANRERMVLRYNRCMKSSKRLIDFLDFFGSTPSDWFLSAVEADKDCFIENRAYNAGRIFHEKTKGAPAHYLSYFRNDVRLAGWANNIQK